MKILSGSHEQSAYPRWEVLVATALLYLSPFVSPLLVLVALVIFALRVVLNDAKTFATDYALLVPLTPLFSFEGMSLLVYLGLFAALWYFFTNRLCKQILYAVLLLVFNYLLLRMPWNLSGFVMCFGQIFLLAVLVPLQDSESAQRTAKMFCASLILSSLFALGLRNSSVMFAIRGVELPAFWGSTAYRFHGLFEDPNYFMTLIVTAMTLLMLLFDRGWIKLLYFVLSELCLLLIGVMTFSKTFLLAMILLVFLSIIWLIRRKKYLIVTGFVLVFVIFIAVLMATSPTLSVLLFRITSATNLDDLTTGRSEVFVAYYNTITDSVSNMLFGVGLGASRLGRDPHNIYLEITYYLGLVGLVLMIALVGAMIASVSKKHNLRKTGASRFLVLIMALFLHLTLHGIFLPVTYAVFFFSIIAMLIEPREG